MLSLIHSQLREEVDLEAAPHDWILLGRYRTNANRGGGYCSTYLALNFTEETDEEIINVFEEIEEKLTNCTKESYIMINSYDQISEYYCNKVYPMLNNFERLLRLLMFNI